MYLCAVVGLGFGIAQLPATIAVCFYFEKRRSLATGIAICGTGIGVFIFAPLTNSLLSDYSWKGTLLIEAGILLNCIVCGIVFRPLNIPKKPDLVEVKALEEETINLVSGEQAKIVVKSTSFELLHTSPESSKDVERRQHFSDSQKSSTSCTSSTELVGPTAQNDSSYYKSLDHTPQCRAECEDHDRSMMTLKEKWLAKMGVIKQMRQRVTEMIDFRLLLNVVFILFAVSNSLHSIGLGVTYVFLTNRGLRLGFDNYESTLLLSTVGISNTVGRLVFGFIGDMKCVNRLVLCCTLRVFCGICSVFSVYLRTFPLQLCFSFSFGFFTGTYSTVES